MDRSSLGSVYALGGEGLASSDSDINIFSRCLLSEATILDIREGKKWGCKVQSSELFADRDYRQQLRGASRDNATATKHRKIEL